MQCVVIGITPPTENQSEEIRQKIHLPGLQWQAGHHLADDDDHDGILTLLVSATIDEEILRPDDVVAAVNDNFAKLDTQATAELWASAGAPLPLRPLEGYETHITMEETSSSNLSSQSFPLEKATQAMQEWGLVVQPQIMTAELLQEFRHVVDEAIATTESNLAKYRPSLRVGTDSFCFREIASRNRNRFDLRLDIEECNQAKPPPAIALVQRLLQESPSLQKFLRTAMDLAEDESNNDTNNNPLDFDVSVVYSRPGAPAQGWHADGNHLVGASEAGWNIEEKNSNLAKPYAICMFVPLIDLDDAQVGYTQFWPGSHAHRNLAGMGPVAHVTQSVWNSHGCKAGDGVLYDYRLMHQGMPHAFESSVEIRPILQIIFKQKFYVEKENYGIESIAGVESQSTVG